jgi:endonuclease/exonuclease/phosphatase family metal-dependent hydrolase
MQRFFPSAMLLLAFVMFSPAGTPELQAQDSIRVMYWNLLNFPSAGAVNRQDSMAPVLAFVQPDLILVNELESAGGANDMLSMLNGLGLGPWARSSFVSNQSGVNNLQNLAFYRSDRLTLLGQEEILTDLRDINEYRFESNGGTRFDAYAAHLKAGTGSTNETRRESAINNFKSYISSNPGAPFKLFGGDLNVYTSSEDAYQALLNDAQSTRSTSFGTGASGGMDDRFDHIVLSQSILADTGAVRYLSGSYQAVGNDGNHFNQAVNDGFNAAVPADVADALFQSSDHLPVVLELVLDAGSDTTAPPSGGGCGSIFFSEYIEGSSNNKAIELYNPSDDPVSLAGYEISIYNNGNTAPNNTEILSGTLAGQGTYRIVNSSADPALLALADITSSVTFYNGDDALVLFKDGVAVDAIGTIGVDPGSNWPVGSGSTSEHTLVRKPEVTEGEPDWAIGATQWNVFPQNTFSFFGAHTGDPCSTAACDAATAPSNPVSSIGPSGVTVAWDELPGAVKCEVNGRPLGAPNFAKVRGDVPPHAFFIPAGALNPGTDYEWKVRCACSLSPLVTTPFSPLDNFTWPLLRSQQRREMPPAEATLSVHPNPACSQVVVLRTPLQHELQPSGNAANRTEQAGAESTASAQAQAMGEAPKTPPSWTVYRASGEPFASGIWPDDGTRLVLDCSTWPTGQYYVHSPTGGGFPSAFARFSIAR